MAAEAYELVKAECEDSKQRWVAFIGQPWANFARTVRHTVNHALLVIEPWKVTFPLTWRDRTFTLDMKDKPLNTSPIFFDMPHAFKLVEDMAAFCYTEYGAKEIVYAD